MPCPAVAQFRGAVGNPSDLRGTRRGALVSSWHEGRSKFLQAHPVQRLEGEGKTGWAAQGLGCKASSPLACFQGPTRTHPAGFPTQTTERMCQQQEHL